MKKKTEKETKIKKKGEEVEQKLLTWRNGEMENNDNDPYAEFEMYLEKIKVCWIICIYCCKSFHFSAQLYVPYFKNHVYCHLNGGLFFVT